MAKISAWMAAVAGVLIITSTILRLQVFEIRFVGPLIAAVLLIIGSWRTLTSRGAGQRILAGAWGLAAAFAWEAAAQFRALDFAPDLITYVVVMGSSFAGPTIFCAIGLTLIVLHQEEK